MRRDLILAWQAFVCWSFFSFSNWAWSCVFGVNGGAFLCI